MIHLSTDIFHCGGSTNCHLKRNVYKSKTCKHLKLRIHKKKNEKKKQYKQT